VIPAPYQFELYRGDTGRWQFVLWDDTGKTQPTDLTGVIAAAQIRDKPAGSIITDLSCTVTLPNTIDVVLAAADSQTLPLRGVWDLQLTYPSGDINTVVGGAVMVIPDVTDSSSAAAKRQRRQ
jgi:hypothetical protein